MPYSEDMRASELLLVFFKLFLSRSAVAAAGARTHKHQINEENKQFIYRLQCVRARGMR